MHYYTDIITHGQIEFPLSETSGLSGKRTRTARLVDRDANDCAIPPPPKQVSDTQLASELSTLIKAKGKKLAQTKISQSLTMLTRTH